MSEESDCDCPKPDFGELLKRAGGMISSASHIFTVQHKKTGEWRNVLVFEDMEKKQFCFAFEIAREQSIGIIASLMAGVDLMEGKTKLTEGELKQ